MRVEVNRSVQTISRVEIEIFLVRCEAGMSDFSIYSERNPSHHLCCISDSSCEEVLAIESNDMNVIVSPLPFLIVYWKITNLLS